MIKVTLEGIRKANRRAAADRVGFLTSAYNPVVFAIRRQHPEFERVRVYGSCVVVKMGSSLAVETECYRADYRLPAEAVSYLKQNPNRLIRYRLKPFSFQANRLSLMQWSQNGWRAVPQH